MADEEEVDMKGTGASEQEVRVLFALCGTRVH
jgi:hypothetical protein